MLLDHPDLPRWSLPVGFVPLPCERASGAEIHATEELYVLPAGAGKKYWTRTM